MTQRKLHMLHVENKTLFHKYVAKSVKSALKCDIRCSFLWHMKQKDRLGLNTSRSGNQNVINIETYMQRKDNSIKWSKLLVCVVDH